MAFQQYMKEAGVDDALPTPWMMVRHDGFNLALLPGGKGLTLKPDNQALINVTDAGDRLDPKAPAGLSAAIANWKPSDSVRLVVVVANNTAGDTTIKATDAKGGVKAQLDVSVKRPRTVKVVFNFVRHLDSSNKPVNHTSKDPTMAPAWIDGMNKIYTPQSDVVFAAQEARWVQYDKQFDAVIRPSDFDVLFKKRIDGSGIINFFIVGEFEKDNNRRSRGDISKGITDNYQNIVCEDIGSNEKHAMPVLLAHEALHWLLREDHHAYDKQKTNLLMEQWDVQTGYKIPKHQANKLNPTLGNSKPGKK